MADSELHYLSITEAAALVQSRRLSPVELTQLALDRIGSLDAGLHSYVAVTAEVAMAQARQAEQEIAAGKYLGPLHGIPIALKDLYATKGIATTAHSKVLLDWVPDEDATATALLRQAGTVLLGKLAMHEFAFGTPGTDLPFPPARNPWNTAHVPGGSSSGSGAALAAGLCYGSLGSDTGGSIRGPASFCGIVGLKPTYGRVSRHGVVSLSWSLDHAGPMARTVEDCALLMQAIAGHDPMDAACADVPVPDYSADLKSGVQGLRIGVAKDWLNEGEGTEPETLAAFEAAIRELEKLGARRVEIDGTPLINARKANILILISEAYAYHEANLKSRPQDYSRGVRDRVREGAFITATDYIQAQRARTVISGQINAILNDVDVIVSPATPRPADLFDQVNPEAAYARPSFTNPANLTGLPALSVPCGFTSAGLPIGFQIGGRAFDEATVLRAAYAYEQATPWHERHPAM